MNFITGNKFKDISDYILDESGFRKTGIINDIPIFFIKTDFINLFFNSHKPNFKYKIITHNSDFPISDNIAKYIDDDNLINWYGQNINHYHPKLISIPIGIANQRWVHGDENKLNEVIDLNIKKENLIYCNFNIDTNLNERTKCVNSIHRNNLNITSGKDFHNYLQELSGSYFCLSPNGNGVDCHKTWESLYLKTIPIVTESINVNYFKELPIHIIKDWDSFDSNEITTELYFELMSRYDKDKLNIEHYYKKIKR